jgi:predicted dehydrogenase
MPETVKMGLIGLGGISESHIKKYLVMNGKVVLQAAAEVDQDRLNVVCDKYSIPQRYEDPLQLIAEADINALTICMPPVKRAEIITAAMERHVPTLCEKPLTTNADEADIIARAVQKNGTPLLVNFKMRQGENFQEIKKYLQKPEVGLPLTIMCRYALVTDPEIWSPPKWFWDMDISGGMLIENGGHIIDYLLWVAGKAEKVFGFIEQKTIDSLPETYMRLSKTEDNAVIIMKHCNGCTTTLLNTICYPGNRDASLEIATKGGYFMRIDECKHLQIRKGEKIILDAPDQEYGVGDGYTNDHFINDVILAGKKPFVTVEDGIAALKIALAARESGRTGTWIVL